GGRSVARESAGARGPAGLRGGDGGLARRARPRRMPARRRLDPAPAAGPRHALPTGAERIRTGGRSRCYGVLSGRGRDALIEHEPLVGIILLLGAKQPVEILAPIHASEVGILRVGVVLIGMAVAVGRQHPPERLEMHARMALVRRVLPEYPRIHVEA